jgi:hypothetical protein
LSDVEPITAMMDPPSSFIFENNPFHLKHHLLLKTKHFCFSKARLSIRKPFNKTGNQGIVNSSKEGSVAIGLALNYYHLMHQSSVSLKSQGKGKCTGACLVLKGSRDLFHRYQNKKQFLAGGFSIGGAVSSSSTLTSSSFSIHNHI